MSLLFVQGEMGTAIVLALLPALVFCAWWWIQRRTPSTLVAVALVVAAMALSQRILTEGESAVADYRKFLSAGSSVPPLEALKLAGVDMSSPEPVRNALKIFKETIDQLKALKA